MEYREAHDLIEQLHYKGKQLSKKDFDNVHALLSKIPVTWSDKSDIYDALSTLLPWSKQPAAVQNRLNTLPGEIIDGFKNG